MLFDPASIPQVWAMALFGAVALLLIKTVLVASMVRWSGIDTLTAWRTGLLPALGCEFGFALVAIASDAKVIDAQLE